MQGPTRQKIQWYLGESQRLHGGNSMGVVAWGPCLVELAEGAQALPLRVRVFEVGVWAALLRHLGPRHTPQPRLQLVRGPPLQ